MLIDTNVAIGLRDGDDRIYDRYARVASQVAMSLVIVIELEGGVYADPASRAARQRGLDALVQDIRVLPLGLAEVRKYAFIVAAAGFSRRKILDRLIAATAIVHDVTLATSNPADFRDVPGLKVEEWPAG